MLNPQKWYYKGLNCVSRAVLLTDHDGVSIYCYKNTGLYQKEYQSLIKMDKIRYFLTNEPFSYY